MLNYYLTYYCLNHETVSKINLINATTCSEAPALKLVFGVHNWKWP